MPIYEFQCKACEGQFERMVPLAEFEKPQPCEECDSTETERLISAVAVNFTGDDWVSKNNRVRQQMNIRRTNAARRQEERQREQPHVKLTPNFGGEPTGSWAEAQKMAASKGKDPKSYTPYVAKERSST